MIDNADDTFHPDFANVTHTRERFAPKPKSQPSTGGAFFTETKPVALDREVAAKLREFNESE